MADLVFAVDDQPPVPSTAYPGRRAGTIVYGDGQGFYYHCERVRGDLRDPEASYSISTINARRAMNRIRVATQPRITLEDMREELSRVGREALRSTEMGTEFFINEAIKGADGEVVADGFVSKRILDHLRRHPAEASHLLMDATFKIVPRRPERIQQFFSIHVLHMDIAVPVAFFFMLRKTEATYRSVLALLRERFLQWHIATVTTDFEMALVNAVREVFPEARHQGCWFHFRQNIWKHAVAQGLLAIIRAEDDETKRVVKMLMAIPHLPPHPGPPHDRRVPPYGLHTIWSC
ncbi:uncharacterized protein LOC120353561 [Nilaparvata lugens]|uniref:uncharacterized protein LOC120353561 n=1 Tax=Nilaparvata lugens TaxID=108931 RepID=UPI00193DFC21|nr:uncharacterized protein LOC120353561 [Nilaparvata lugens]XP_039293566.1 uncharacterized protein LOC120353561 [Nilaparvata lugens]XP_039293570.1 uncharacterized protein LOC120353561 [Nilaparvata lugens]XP_039293578.1 uncharacterized protein LOC120353561 [Nilaparvata lugens]